jgi:hypothetical protein
MTYHDIGFGPSFGGGIGIKLFNNGNTNNNSYASLGFAYGNSKYNDNK